ncbi:MAG: hypothetical protein ABSG53_34315 [Thermoguttaceae bacterium]|jgi:hypothetical protein
MLLSKKLPHKQAERVIYLCGMAQTMHTDGMLPAAWEPHILEAEQILNAHEGRQAGE